MWPPLTRQTAASSSMTVMMVLVGKFGRERERGCVYLCVWKEGRGDIYIYIYIMSVSERERKGYMMG